MSGFLSGKDERNRQRILEGTFVVFRDKGAEFTMNDLSNELGMSKKTIYTVFRDKESLLYTLVDYFFDSVKEDEGKILGDPDLNTRERLEKMLGVIPTSYSDIDFSSVYLVREKYPRVEKRLSERLESGWEKTLAVLDQGVEEGIFRPVDHVVFQITFEAAIERFLSGDELRRNHIRYPKALEELTKIMVGGILA